MQESDIYHRLVPEAAASIASRLGLDRFGQAGCAVDFVERVGATLRFGFQWAGVGMGTVSISAPDGLPAFLATPNLVFRFNGPTVTRPWAVLMSRMATEAGGMTIDELLALSGGQVDSVAQPAPKAPPYNPVVFWGPEDGWRSFMCDAAMERRFREAFEFDSDSSFIVHGDLECRFVAPGARVRLPGYFVYPFDLFSHNEAVGPITELDDRDVILDSTLKIEQKVRREREAGAFRGPVVVISTCVPTIVAEDPTNVLARLEPLCPEGIRYVSQASQVGPSEIFMQSFAGLRGAVLARPPEPRTAGFVGYRPGRARDELSGLLSRLGIRVTGGIVPLVTRRLLSETLSAGTIVVAPSRYYESMYAGLTDGAPESGRTRITPDYPWGIAATRRWLETVAAACGAAEGSHSLASEEAARADAGIRGPVEDRVFLFVCDPDQISRLTDPLSPSGLPLIPFMLELGLACRVAVFGNSDACSAAADQFDAAFGNARSGGLVEFAAFADREGLDAILSSPDVAAVYSEMFFDRRATRAGIPTFSSRIFEPGFDGAVRTAARFRRLAGLPFYRRYFRSAAN
jgi:hypothetical protein